MLEKKCARFSHSERKHLPIYRNIALFCCALVIRCVSQNDAVSFPSKFSDY